MYLNFCRGRVLGGSYYFITHCVKFSSAKPFHLLNIPEFVYYTLNLKTNCILA